jgi:hypothetical protein
MVWHLVLMKPRLDLSAADRAALVDAFERATREIPSVRQVQLGRRVVHGAGYERDMPDAADYVAMIAFDDLEGLQAYLHHPAHTDLGVAFGRSLSAALVYDFEMAGSDGEALTRGRVL